MDMDCSKCSHAIHPDEVYGDFYYCEFCKDTLGIVKCEISKGNEPFSPPHWICPECDSTYVIEDSFQGCNDSSQDQYETLHK